MNSPLVKSLKTVKSMAGSASTLAEIKRHRKQADLASRLATPKGNVDRRGFRVGKIRCEEFKPNRSYDPDYVILYCHGGGYITAWLRSILIRLRQRMGMPCGNILQRMLQRQATCF